MPLSTHPAGTFEPGSSFGEYTIVRRIGRGGQGSVYEVTDGLGLTWALKVSEEMALGEPQAELRFAREARCVAENLSEIPRNVGILIGEHYGVWARRFYIKMKLLQGESLAQRLRRVGQLSIYDAARIFERVAFAVGHAHKHGVLHRDLKPENIFITTRDEVLVLDWGCLQLIEAGQARTTLNGVMCTPGYAPIEQYLATSVVTLTPAADLYALGVMFYEALAGYHPFLNWSRAALNQARPKTVAPAVPEDLAPRLAETQTVVVPTSVLRRLKAQLGVEPAERSGDVFTNGKTWKSRCGAPAHAESSASVAPSAGAVTPWGRTGATFPLPDDVQIPKPSARPNTAPSTRTIRPAAALGTPAAPIEGPPQRADSHPAKRGVPRRFSLVQVLALQERTVPQAICGIPRELQLLLSRLLAKRATDRPQDALRLAQQLCLLLDKELKESRETFAESAPEQHSKYLARALWWTQLRQSSSRFGYAAAGIILSALTGIGSYYGMSLTHAEAVDEPVAGPAATTRESATAPSHLGVENEAADRSQRPKVELAVEPELPKEAVLAAELEPPTARQSKGSERRLKISARKEPALVEPLANSAEPTVSAAVLPSIQELETPIVEAPIARPQRLRGAPRARLPGTGASSRVVSAKATGQGAGL